ncbi:N-acetylneuraminate synthase [Brevibacillus sp. NRS-1366]|uniref:N-acetylneuraminate synthase n=1 Tax=Brevibacillus sp. NRS-1366 TaxID=3233899 RepID=UPI003D1A2756
MIRIGNRTVSDQEPAYIIAEIGVNHNGSIELAKKLVDLAHEAKVDAVKFQMFHHEELVSGQAGLVEYQKRSGYSSQHEMLRQLELSEQDFAKLKLYCDGRGITFLSTPFDGKSADFLQRLEVGAFKVGSGDLTHYPLLRQIQSYGKPILLSTGMSTLSEIEAVLDFLGDSCSIALFHCTSAYPAPYEDLNLRVMETLRSAFRKTIGYSDHSLGVEVPIAAVAMGYTMIEKHFTLDTSMEGPDHRASLDPAEMKRMVQAIRHIEAAVGKSIKRIAPSESETRRLVRRGIFAGRDLEPGVLIGLDDLLYLRPLSSIEACDYQKVIGKILRRPKKKGEPFSFEDFS